MNYSKLMKVRGLTALLMLGTLYSCAHPAPVLAADYGDKLVAINRVHDGDTITVSIPDWPAVIGTKIPVRVYGIDTPELNGKCADEKEKALMAKTFTASFVSGKQITLKHIQRDMYFRILADVYVDNDRLADELIKAGLARPYFGGTKTSWCNTL